MEEATSKGFRDILFNSLSVLYNYKSSQILAPSGFGEIIKNWKEEIFFDAMKNHINLPAFLNSLKIRL
jgi:hypothetical protein